MIVKIYENLENFEEFNFNVDNIRDVLSGIKMLKGEKYSNKILNNNYKFILTSNDTNNKPIGLNKDTFLSNFNGYDNLFLLPEVSGQTGFEEAAIWAAVVSTATEIGIGAEAAVMIGEFAVLTAQVLVAVGVSMALNGIMQLLSPTTSFSSDPAQAQQMQSSLFNGAPLIREQGGSVPLWYGSSYIGGVLISSSISTAEG